MFTFSEIFIFPYGFELLSNVSSFYLAEIPWAFLAGWFSGHELLHILPVNFLISHSLRTVLLDMGFLVNSFFFFILAFWIYKPTICWLPKLLMNNLFIFSLRIHVCDDLFLSWDFQDSLSFSFENFTIMCLRVGLFEFILEFVDLLGCLYSCLSSNLGRF